MDFFDKRDNVPLCDDGTDNISMHLGNAGSEIQEFYENKSVLVTEVSGLGGLLVDKLLRSCPKIQTIYLLMKREKKKLPEEKCDEFFFSEVFDKINQTHHHLKKKIKILYGDYSQPCCGISEDDQKMLNNEIQIVFHCAGTASKYENPKSLIYNNIQSTKSLLELSSEMKNLKAFIYISTINAKNFQQDIEEHFHEIILSDDIMNSWEEQLRVIAPRFLERRGEFNDFTKAVAEEVVRKYNGKIPIAIARSPNEGCSQKDYTAMLKKLFNIQTETHSTLISALKYYTHRTRKNLILSDNFINTIVALSWQIGTNKSNRNNINTPAYDVIPSWNSRIPTECEENLIEGTNLIYQAISKQSLRIEKQHLSNHKQMYYPENYPVLFLLMLNLYMMVYRNINKLFDTNDLGEPSEDHNSTASTNTTSNLEMLWSSLSNVDKKLFNFDIINNDWDKCDSRNIRNMIAYLFKEDLSDLEMNNAHYVRYQQVKKYFKRSMYWAGFYYILHNYFLSLLQCFNLVFL